MVNDIKVTVSADDFKQKTPAEQSYIIYKVVSAQQSKCALISGDFGDRLDEIEVNRKVEKAKIVGIGVSSGGGAAALYSIVKSWFGGGG